VVPSVLRTARGTSDLRVRILREQAETLWKPLIDRSIATTLQTLAMSSLAASDLAAIYLSGGTTHIPMVRQALHQHFGIAPRVGVPVDFAVSLGAGIHAAQLELDVDAPTLSSKR
jgi:molecular chaperone DnaK (HSP70)